MIRLTQTALGIVLGVSLLVGCGPHVDRNTPPPTVPANFAVRPLFQLRDGHQIQAGTAFATTLDGSPPVLLSAMHLFGEAGGLDHDLPAATLPEAISAVAVYDMEYNQPLAHAGAELIRDSKAADFEANDMSQDVVAFALDANVPLGVLPLAKTNPAVGTRVWAVGREYKDHGATAKLYGGTITEVKATNIVMEEDTPFEGRGFSGGPVVNAQGQVIGTVIGGGKIYGHAVSLLNPVESIRRHLQTAGISPH